MSRYVPIAAAALIALVPDAVSAHAHLVHAEPAAGARVTASPSAVTLAFSEKIVAKLCDVTVRDASGKTLASGHEDAGDAALRVTIGRALGPGTYTVTWRVVSVDTHRTQGRLSFTVTP